MFTSHLFDQLKGARILITGASGFIGSRLCRQLLTLGVQLYCVSRRPQPMKGEQWLQCDLEDAAAVRRAVVTAKPTYVFHLAGATSAARTLAMMPTTFRANLMSTVNLLTALAEAPPARVVIAGSMEEPDTAGDAASPSSPYAASKFAAAAYARLFTTQFNVPCVHARIFMVYGPGQRDVQKLVPYVATSLLADRSPKLSTGARLVDWVYVDDVVRDLMMAMVTPKLAGRSIDLGTGTLTPVRSVVDQIARLIQSTAPVVMGEVADRASEQVRSANVGQRVRLIGDAPATPLSEGLTETVAWYRAEMAAGRIEPVSG